MAHVVSKYRVFVAVPHDLEDEIPHIREAVRAVNADFGRYLHCELDLVYWRTDTAPRQGGPDAEGAILSQIDLGSIDIFLGLMWTYYGSPTSAYDSGFVEEVEKAWQLAEESGRPRMMLYFCKKMKSPDDIDPEQMRKCRGFERAAKKRSLCREYKDLYGLSNSLRSDLSRALGTLHEACEQADTAAEVEMLPTAPESEPSRTVASGRNPLGRFFEARAETAPSGSAPIRPSGMETISIYSYEGMWETRHATAQFAICLARLGLRVCILDLDFAQPDLCDWIPDTAKHVHVEMGLVDCLHDFLETGHVSSVDRLAQVLELGCGSLFIISSGASLDAPWGRSYGHRYEIERFLTGADDRAVEFFTSLKERFVADLDPDYLLVHCPSGLSSLAWLAMVVLSGTALLLFTQHGLNASNRVLRMLEASRARRPSSGPEITPVLVGAPSSFIDADGQVAWIGPEELSRIREDALFRINYYLREPLPRVHVLRTLSRPYGHEFPIMPEGRTPFSDLAEDYVALLADLVPGARDQLRGAFGLQTVLKPYFFDRTDGLIINPEDNTANVVFRAGTITALLESLARSIEGRQAETREEVVEETRRALSHAGREAADSFSKYLEASWSMDVNLGDESGFAERLDRWALFDSAVGLGRFEVSAFADGRQGRITLHNSFLIRERDSSDINLCPFMQGYLTRILQAVYGEKRIVVEHPVELCGQYAGAPSAPCIFEFRVEDPVD